LVQSIGSDGSPLCFQKHRHTENPGAHDKKDTQPRVQLRMAATATDGVQTTAHTGGHRSWKVVAFPKVCYCALSHFATAQGQNLTDVPMRKDGIRPAFACLKIVIRETDSSLARSSAVRARPVRSICSASESSKDCMASPKEIS